MGEANTAYSFAAVVFVSYLSMCAQVRLAALRLTIP